MARNLYRFYLYFVFIAMLSFATIAAGQLLQPLLSLTSLRGAYSSAPSNTTLVQAAVFAVVSWVIAGLLGGLHYWLIRRDMKSDPAAGGSAIRAFFLNVAELLVAPTAIGVSAFGLISELGRAPASDVTGSAAFSIALLALLGVLEWERQRAPAAPGAAMAFQRLHLYGVQLILLVLLTFSWIETLRWLLDDIAFGGKVSGLAPCGGFTGCQGPNLLSLIASTLWVILSWIGYGYFNREDTQSLLRRILHFASFAYGVVFILLGVWSGIDLIVEAILKVPVTPSDIVNPADAPNFVSAITLGLLVIAVYSLWLRMASRQQPAEWAAMLSTMEAIAAALLAAGFWWGCGIVLLNAIESVLPAGNVPNAQAWASAIALVITGLAYIPLGLYLHRRSGQEAAAAAIPWRGFVFALLGGGTLAGAIGGAVALYALGTSLLGSPLSNWTQVARGGLAAFVVGAVIVALYLWTALREHLFSGPAKPPVPPAPEPSTIEGVLDELLAHKISRDEAAALIRALAHPAPAGGEATAAASNNS